MIDTAVVEDRLRRTFDAVAATTRIEAHRTVRGRRPPGRRRAPTSTILPAAALVAAVITIVVVLLFARGGDTPVKVRTNTPATNATITPGGFRPIPGMIVVSDESGHPVGYARASDVHMPTAEYMKKVNARTMWPVTDANGTVVGYIAPDVPFIPRALTEERSFDLEKVRAARNGGCEDHIGNPKFKQEFPPCHDGSGGQ